MDELEEFKQSDSIEFGKLKSDHSTISPHFSFADSGNFIAFYQKLIYKIDSRIIIKEDLSFEMYVRSNKIKSKLRIQNINRFSQLKELLRQLLFASELIQKMVQFSDRQNELMIHPDKGRRYDRQDLKVCLDLVSTSRSAYVRLRSFMPLPSLRTLQNLFSSSQNVEINSIISSLTPMQRNIHLTIDEIYVQPSVRFTADQIYGYSCDNSSCLAQTVFVLF